MSFRQNLKRIRVQKGFSVIEMCKKTNISRAAWYAYESGNNDPTLKVLRKISRTLNCSILDLDTELRRQVNLDKKMEEVSEKIDIALKERELAKGLGVSVSDLDPDLPNNSLLGKLQDLFHIRVKGKMSLKTFSQENKISDILLSDLIDNDILPSLKDIKKILSVFKMSLSDLDSELGMLLNYHELSFDVMDIMENMDNIGKAKMLTYAARIEETVAGGIVAKEPNLENEKREVS